MSDLRYRPFLSMATIAGVMALVQACSEAPAPPAAPEVEVTVPAAPPVAEAAPPVSATAPPVAETAPDDGTAPAEETAAPPAPAGDHVDPATADFDTSLAAIIAARSAGEFQEALAAARRFKAAAGEHPRRQEISQLVSQLAREYRRASGLPYAIKMLTDRQGGATARSALLDANEIGVILLRRAVRTADEDTVKAALPLLLSSHDSTWLADGLERLEAAPLTTLSAAITDAARESALGLEPALAQRCLARIRNDDDHQWRECAAWLESALRVRCQGDAAAFAAYVDSETGFRELRRYIESAMTARDPDLVQWACTFGGDLAGLFNGVEATYFADIEAVGEPTVRRHEVRPQLSLGTNLPLPDQQENAAARWHGLLSVPAAGRYTFYLQADDSGKLLLDERTVVKSSGWAEATVELELTAGLHPLAVQLAQNRDKSGLQLTWSGPDLPRRPLGLADLRARPWPEPVLALGPAAQALTAADPEVSKPARRSLQMCGTVSTMHLRKILRQQRDATAAAALETLVALDDPRTPETIVNLVLANPGELAMHSHYAEALRALPHHLPASLLPDLFARVAADTGSETKVLAAALAAVFAGPAASDPAAFDALVAAANASAELAAYVDRVLNGDDLEAVAFMAAFGTPFTPLLSGLRGQYYLGEDRNELVADRLDTRLSFSANFPQRQERISARWQGFLAVPEAGDYALRQYAENWAGVTLDGKQVLAAPGWIGHRYDTTLTAGLHPLSIAFQQPAGGNTRIMINIIAAEQPERTLDHRDLRCYPWYEATRALAAALPELVLDGDHLALARQRLAARRIAEPAAAEEAINASLAEVRRLESAPGVAADLFRQYDPVSRILLRYAVRHAADEVAAAAADLLVELGDPLAPPVLVTRLAKAAKSPLANPLTDSLRRLVEHLDPALVPQFLPLLDETRPLAAAPYAGLLCAAYDRLCGQDAAAFNTLAEDPAAIDKLQSFISGLLVSNNPTAVQVMLANGAPLTPSMPGWHAAYYHGPRREELIVQRADRSVSRAQNTFPGAQSNLSVRWRGVLTIAEGGSYTFFLYGDNRLRLHLDNRPAAGADGWVGVQHTVDLTAGAHPITVELSSWSGLARADLLWSGPGIEGQQPVDARWVSTPPWPALLAELQQATTEEIFLSPGAVRARRKILELAEADLKRVHDAGADETAAKARAAGAAADLALVVKQPGVARDLLQRVDPVGRVLLRNAVRYADAFAAAAAVELLADLADPDAAATVLGRLTTDPTGPLAATLTAGLRRLSPYLAAAEVSAMLTRIRGDTDGSARAFAAVLSAVFDRACARAPAAFDELAGQASATEELRGYVDHLLAGDDLEAIKFMLAYGAPLTPGLNGWAAQYYNGHRREELQLERLDAAIAINTNQFPHQQQDLSVRWSGVVDVPDDGDYQFALWGDNRIELWLDGRRLHRVDGWQGAKQSVTLAHGPHHLHVDLSGWSGFARAQVSWEGPGIDGQQALDRRWLEAAPWPALLDDLQQAAAALALAPVAATEANDAPQMAIVERVDQATALLQQMDPVARPLLRHAVRYGQPAAAIAAAAALADCHDAGAVDAMSQRLATAPEPGLATALTDALCALVDTIPAQLLQRWQQGLAAGPTAPAAQGASAILCRALLVRCNTDAARYDDLLATPGAYQQLQQHVVAGLAHEHAEIMACYYRYGAPFAPLLDGLQAQVYRGKQRVAPVSESVVPAAGGSELAISGNTPTSARWVGLLRVEQAGEYLFELQADQSAALWLDGQLVRRAEGWTPQSASLVLQPGLHPLRLDLSQAAGAPKILLRWQGPGMPLAPLTGAQVTTAAPASLLARLPRAVAALAEARGDNPRLTTARPTMLEAQAIGAIYLQQYLTAEPSAAAAVLSNLRGISGQLHRRYTDWLLQEVAADTEGARQAQAELLCHLLDDTCSRDPAKFNGQLRREDAFPIVKACVERALASTNVDWKKWAITAAPIVGVPLE